MQSRTQPNGRTLAASAEDPGVSPRSTAELVQATREAWLECEGLHPLPEPVWKLLGLVPELCAAVEREAPQGGAVAQPRAAAPRGEQAAARLSRLFAHELRNRVLPLEMALQALEVDGTSIEAREQAERQLRLLLAGLERLAADLSSLGAPPGGEAAPLARIAAEVFEANRLEADALGVDLLADPLPATPVDAAVARLALHNLVLNGLRFHDRRKNERWVRVSARREEGAPVWLRVEVADNGVGISPGLQLHLAKVSIARPDESNLAGLGLAICREAVERLGGRLGLTSREGVGTAAWFTLAEKQEPTGG
jgi:signal transduction histidine kinase